MAEEYRTMSAGTALITGASSGIGLELAKVFAAHGHDLVLVARRREKLVALARELEQEHGVVATVFPCDLARAGAARRVFAFATRRGIEVDVLVNNAGVMHNGEFADAPLARHLEVLKVDVLTPTELCHLFLGPMLTRRRGRILNVGSMAGFQPIPRLAVYAASKAYVLHLTEALSEELIGTGVTVTALCPGFTATETLDQAPDVAKLPTFAIGSTEAVAEDGYAACMNGEVVQVTGATNRLAALFVQHQPRWLTRAIGGVLARRNR
jgi:uncharacterized protein